MGSLGELFSTNGFMPHIHCYLGRPSLVWTMAVTDGLIGAAYISISFTLWGLIRRIRASFSLVVLCFGVFILACGLTHFMEVYTLWVPAYWFSAMVKSVTVIASLGTGIYLYRLRHQLVTMAEAVKLSEQRLIDLELLTQTLEERVEERTKLLNKAVATRDELFSIASHELKTPLTAIKLRVQMAKRIKNFPEPEKACHELAADLEGQVDSLVKLIDGMLDVSRCRSGRLKMTLELQDLAEVVNGVLERLQPQLQNAGISLSKEVPEKVVLFFDRMRIEQVLGNLINNAIRYAPGCPLHVSLVFEHAFVKLVVRDSGPGISGEDQERIFHLFERIGGSPRLGGLGVGLYLSRSIVQAHGGSINICSEKGKGAEFLVRLPYVVNKNKASEGIEFSTRSY